ncbi:MAG: hypothetical protein AAF830_11525 [Pseudomonadota bacterium]
MSAEETHSNFVEPNYLDVVKWVVAAPVAIIWMMASSLPIYSLFGLSRDPVTITLDILFLGSGFFGLVTLYVAAQFSAKDHKAREEIVSMVRGKGNLIAGYGMVWITFYTLYRWFIA